jgi:hypothetical protein
LLFDFFQNGNKIQKNTPNYREQLVEIIIKYPSLYGLKWWLMLDGIFLPNTQPPEEVLDIFKHELSKHTQVAMKKRFDGMLESTSPENMSFLFEDLMGGEVPKEMDISLIFREVTIKIQKTFSDVVNKYELHPDAKILLSCYKTVFKQIANNQKVFDKKDTTITSLEKEYEKALKLLNEHHPDSQYYKDFKNRNAYILMDKIMDNLVYQPESKSFLKNIDRLIEESGETYLVNQLLINLDDVHYEGDFVDGTAKLLLHIHNKTDQLENSPLFWFGQKFYKLADAHSCDCAEVFFVNIANKLGRSAVGKKVQEERPLYPFLKGYGKKLQSRKLLKPVREFQKWLNLK